MADPWTTPVAPFNPAATQEPRDGAGCGKALVIGCGLLLVLLAAGMVAITLEAPAILRWSFRLAESSITPRLPADTTPAERQRLHRAFEAAGRTKVGDQAGLARLQRAQRKIMALSGSAAPLTHQQVRELTEALEGAAGMPPAAPTTPGPVSRNVRSDIRPASPAGTTAVPVPALFPPSRRPRVTSNVASVAAPTR